MNVADYDERLLLGGVGVASLFLLLLLLFGAGAGVLSESNGGTEGEAEAERHDDKLFHFSGDLLKESTMFSSLEVSYPSQHEGKLNRELKSLNKARFLNDVAFVTSHAA